MKKSLRGYPQVLANLPVKLLVGSENIANRWNP